MRSFLASLFGCRSLQNNSVHMKVSLFCAFFFFLFFLFLVTLKRFNCQFVTHRTMDSLRKLISLEWPFKEIIPSFRIVFYAIFVRL